MCSTGTNRKNSFTVNRTKIAPTSFTMGLMLSRWNGNNNAVNASSNEKSRPNLPAPVPSTWYDYIPDDFPWVWAIRDIEILDWKAGLTDDEIMELDRRHRDLPVHIHGNIFLGNVASVENISKLQGLGITRVLNLAGPMALKRNTIRAFKQNSITYKGIPAEDEENYPLLAKHWHEIHAFLHGDETTDSSGNTVIHCVAGINRSVLVVRADYILSCQQPVLDAVKHVRKQRGNIALSNSYFQEQLVAFARRNDLLGPEPGTAGSVISHMIIPHTGSMMKTSRTGRPQRYQSLFADL